MKKPDNEMDDNFQAKLEVACQWAGIWKPGQRCDGSQNCHNDDHWAIGIEPPLPYHGNDYDIRCPSLTDELAMRLLSSILKTQHGVELTLMDGAYHVDVYGGFGKASLLREAIALAVVDLAAE